MDSDRTLELLFQYASNYKLIDFNHIYTERIANHDTPPLDACLMQAQIKLISGDETFIQDLETADRLGGKPHFPCLYNRWIMDGPNRFFLFRNAPRSPEHFFTSLPPAKEILTRFYGDTSAGIIRQIQSEMLYYHGAFEDAIKLAKEQYLDSESHSHSSILAQYVLFRCALATGRYRDAEKAMLDMVLSAKINPACLKAYRVIRSWANATTGWSGETPRFQKLPEGDVSPDLSDRLSAIQKGISHLTPLEKTFEEYATLHYDHVYSMRQYFMNVFNAMYWFQIGDLKQTETSFLSAYQTAENTALIVPFIEYGKQIIPLLEYIKSSDLKVSPALIDQMLTMARSYETNLNAYRIFITGDEE